jgi:hypothetical protein
MKEKVFKIKIKFKTIEKISNHNIKTKYNTINLILKKVVITEITNGKNQKARDIKISDKDIIKIMVIIIKDMKIEIGHKEHGKIETIKEEKKEEPLKVILIIKDSMVKRDNLMVIKTIESLTIMDKEDMDKKETFKIMIDNTITTEQIDPNELTITIDMGKDRMNKEVKKLIKSIKEIDLLEEEIILKKINTMIQAFEEFLNLQ